MKTVIDVSTWQGKIDWEKVKPHIAGAIIRCGYGSDLEKYDDDQFKRNADACTRLGIPFGVYLYSYAKTNEKAKSEAEHVLRLVKDYKLSYPIYYDLEEAGTEKGAVERANIFGDLIEKAGYWCGVYANLNWWNNYLVGLERFTKWVAQYHTKCDYKGANLDIWQYSSKGTIPGIKGNVDMNYCYRDFPTEILNGEKKPAEDKKPRVTVEEAVQMILRGELGNGNTRKVAIEALKLDYDEVQKRVNELYKKNKPTQKSVAEIAKEVIHGNWGNGETRKKKLESAGYDYDAVQKEVNRMLK